MDWWLGFNQCWPMDRTCVVNWDAWALLVGVAGSLFAWISIIVTAASAVAVFWLGRQANGLAMTAKEFQERSVAEQRREALEERSREAKVVLAYCSAELKTLGPALAGLIGMLNFDGAEELFVTSRAAREQIRDKAKNLSWSRLEKVLPRLHAIPSDTGMRLARVLGATQTLAAAFEVHANEESPADRQGDADSWDEYLRTSFANRLRLLKVADALADSLWRESSDALAGIGEHV